MTHQALLDHLIRSRTGTVIEAVEDETVTLTLRVPVEALYRALAAARSEHLQTLGGASAEYHPDTQEEPS